MPQRNQHQSKRALATMTIGGVDYALILITIRRSVGVATMDFKLFGRHSFSVGTNCTFKVAGLANIHADIVSVSSTDRSTTILADITPSSGAGIYDPVQIQYRSSNVIRGDLCFATLPGDTYAGRVIQSVTSTLGAASVWFNEVRFCCERRPSRRIWAMAFIPFCTRQKQAMPRRALLSLRR